MTDESLRRLALAAFADNGESFQCVSAWDAYYDALDPQTVLSLLDRLAAAEREVELGKDMYAAIDAAIKGRAHRER